MELFIIFVTGYFSVFLMGFQSRSVNSGNYLWAAFCSFSIAISQASIWNKLTSPDADRLDAFVFGLSGATGITSAMWMHKYLSKKKGGK